MESAQNEVVITPGQDDSQHAAGLQQEVADTLSAITGQKIEPESVTPAIDQTPVTQNNLHEEPKTQADLQEIIDAEKGRPRTESSHNFLKILYGRLKKQNPGNDIKVKEG